MSKFISTVVIALSGLFMAGSAFPQAEGGGGETEDTNRPGGCPESGAITKGKFISDLCWDCMFPVRIAGFGASGRDFPGDMAEAVCVCPSASLMGYPTPGVTYGMWKPTHFAETVREPGCFPALDEKVNLGKILGLKQGGGDKRPERSAGHHQTHLYTFPTGAILDMLSSSACSDESADMDMVMVSEIDPTYNIAELSMVVNPEAALFTNAVAYAACMVDSVASSTYRPIRELFWCLGSWGAMYPLAGTAHAESAVQDASILAAKLVAIQSRRFLMNRTYGDSAVCASHPYLIYQKQQYRWQVLYPIPQRNSNDWTGSSTMLSREWRHIPVVGEDWVQVMMRYEECCIHQQ